MSLSGGSGASAAECNTPTAISNHASCAGKYPSPINAAAVVQSAEATGASKRSASRATAGAAINRIAVPAASASAIVSGRKWRLLSRIGR